MNRPSGQGPSSSLEHFSPLGALQRDEIPIITRGEGCYIFDQHGRRYLDGLSGLFVVQIGHGRRELGEAAARQSSELGFFPVWGHGHAPAIELAARLANLAPGDLNRVFFRRAARRGGSLEARGGLLSGTVNRRHNVIAATSRTHGPTFGRFRLRRARQCVNEPLVRADQGAKPTRYRASTAASRRVPPLRRRPRAGISWRSERSRGLLEPRRILGAGSSASGLLARVEDLRAMASCS